MSTADSNQVPTKPASAGVGASTHVFHGLAVSSGAGEASPLAPPPLPTAPPRLAPPPPPSQTAKSGSAPPHAVQTPGHGTSSEPSAGSGRIASHTQGYADAAGAAASPWGTPKAGGSAVRMTHLPNVPEVEDARREPSRATAHSILPKIEQHGKAFRLIPSDGRQRYQGEKVLGRGGMGEVALMEDRDIGRKVAVKRLFDPSMQSAGVLARFIDEIKIVGAMEHPNIVPIHDVGVDEQGRYFFVMKFVDGETMEDVIERLKRGDPEAHRTYTQRRRIEIFIQVLRALHYAHTRGVLHRDIKPANIMIGRFGEVVVMDWGVARPIHGAADKPAEHGTGPDENLPAITRASTTQAGQVVGTPLYASPEQARGKTIELDARSDLFSACVVLHEFLGLRHRIDEVDTIEQVLVRVATTPPPLSMQVFQPHPAQKETIPYEMTHFLRRGLALDPAERWQSAQDMIDELTSILDGKCRVQCPTTLLKRTTSELARFVDRKPGIAMLVLYGGALTVVVFGAIRVGTWVLG